MKTKTLLSIFRHCWMRKKSFVILHADTNFVSLSNDAVRRLDILNSPYVFVYKTTHKGNTVFALRRVNDEFARRAQVGFVTKNWNTGYHVFENMCPTNQAVFFELGLPYDRNQKFTLLPRIQGDTTEYLLIHEPHTTKR